MNAHDAPRRSLLLLVATLLLLSCSGRQGNTQIIDQAQFVAVYADLLEKSAMPGSAAADSAGRSARMDTVLAVSGLTRERFEATIRWYNEDIRRWGSVLDQVVKRLEAKARPPEG